MHGNAPDGPATKAFNTGGTDVTIPRRVRAFLSFFLDPFASAWQKRKLLRELSRREIHTTFNGSILGVGWLVLLPLLQLSVYATVFGGILGLRGNDNGNGMAFVSELFTGLIVFHAFSESVSRASRLVVSRPNYVTKVAFPLDLLPWPVVSLAAVHAAISTALLIVVHVLFVDVPAWTVVLVPLVLVPVLLLGLGVSWVLSSLGVYVRDVNDIVRVALQLLFFLSPIVWPLSRVEDPTARVLLQCNPLAIAMETCRALIAGTPGLPPIWFAGLVGVSLLTVAIGHAFFRRTKDGFADVL